MLRKVIAGEILANGDVEMRMRCGHTFIAKDEEDFVVGAEVVCLQCDYTYADLLSRLAVLQSRVEGDPSSERTVDQAIDTLRRFRAALVTVAKEPGSKARDVARQILEEL
jgi:hypothetical protein